MATEPKLTIPTHAAMSEVEEGLLDPTATGPAPAGDPADPHNAERERGPRGAAHPVVSPDTTAVANDDREEVGLLLQALRTRPSRLPYALAGAASVAWLAGVYYLLSSSAAGDLRTYLGGLSPLEVATAATVTIAPIVLFFIAAMMTVRSFEMRLVGRAVGEVALRLSQPGDFASEAVLNVSRIVRREVAAVGDGLERALARAGELETVVRREISTLEGAYSENEIRIRALLDELVQQREAVVSNADRV